MTQRRMVYLPSIMDDDIRVAIDLDDITAVFHQRNRKMVIGQEAEDICLIHTKTLGEAKPIRCKMTMEEMAELAGWPPPEPFKSEGREAEVDIRRFLDK